MLKPPYKAPGGQWYTKSLFYEVWLTYPQELKVVEPPFTLYADRPGMINARKTFVALNDPTGYKWAIEYLGDWEHWLKLIECSWFKAAYEHWVAELETKLKSESVARLSEIANSESPQAISAAKFLSSLDYKKSPRGRPSKSEQNAELQRLTTIATEVNNDYERIRLVK